MDQPGSMILTLPSPDSSKHISVHVLTLRLVPFVTLKVEGAHKGPLCAAAHVPDRRLAFSLQRCSGFKMVQVPVEVSQGNITPLHSWLQDMFRTCSACRKQQYSKRTMRTVFSRSTRYSAISKHQVSEFLRAVRSATEAPGSDR